MAVTILLVVLALIGSLATVSDGLPAAFDPLTCRNMCRTTNECPANAACMPIKGTRFCGVCVCVFGFRPADGVCVFDSKGGGKAEPVVTRKNDSDATTTGATTVPTTKPTSTSGFSGSTAAPLTSTVSAVTAGRTDWDCSPFRCHVSSPNNNDPLQIGTVVVNTRPGGCSDRNLFGPDVRCENVVGGSSLCSAGSQCLKVNKKSAYCMCPYNKAGLTCHMLKRKACHLTTGRVPEDSNIGKRFIHKHRKHTGAVFARHFAPTLEACVRLCEWAGPRRCRSLNYGPTKGKQVCELLSVWAKATSPLHHWLVAAPGWQYVCCFYSRRN